MVVVEKGRSNKEFQWRLLGDIIKAGSYPDRVGKMGL